MIAKAFKTAFIVLIISALVTEFFCGTFSTIIDYWLSDLNSATKGVVIKSEKTRSTGGKISVITYDIEYEYMVDRVSYRNSRVTYGRSDENPYKILDRYPVGKEVTVHYDSSRPAYPVLEKKGLGSKTYRQVAAVVFLFFGTFVWIYRRGR